MIIKLAGVYLQWSSVVDAPTYLFDTLDAVREHVREENGRLGLQDFERVVERLEQQGVASVETKTPEDVVWLNHAGRDGTCLTIPQIIAFYCMGRGEGLIPAGLNDPICYERRNATEPQPICGKCGCQDKEQ